MWNASLKEGHSFSPLRRSAVAKLLFLALVLFTLSCFVNHESFDGGKEGLRKLDSSLTGTRLLAESHEHIHGDKAGNTGERIVVLWVWTWRFFICLHKFASITMSQSYRCITHLHSYQRPQETIEVLERLFLNKLNQ